MLRTFTVASGLAPYVNTNVSQYSVTALILFRPSIILTISHIYQQIHAVGLQTVHKV